MSRIARKTISIETHNDREDIPHPVALYYNGEKRTPSYTPQTGWDMNSLCMHALLQDLGFETVLEYPSGMTPDDRSIFIGIKPGHYADYIATQCTFAKPRFTGI